MFGKTNSFVQSAQSNGEGADVVYAVNNTGGDITIGDKVWLNKHLYGDVEEAHISSGSSYSPYPVPFNLGRQMFVNKTTTVCRVEYNAGTNSLNYRNMCSTLYDRVVSVIYKDGLVWMVQNDGSSYVFKNSGEHVKVNGCVLSADKVFDKATSRLELYNSETGAIVSSGGFQLPTFSTPMMMFLDDNLLFYQKGASDCYIYDVTNYAAPVLLSTPKYSFNYVYALYVTGIKPGNYVFCRYSGNNESDSNSFYLYKINQSYGFELAGDVPESLASLIGVNCRFSYNDKTKIFIIGTSSKLFYYKFENGMFHEFFVTISGLPKTDANYAYLARLSDDMLTMVITCRSGSYYSHVYRLKPMDDNWYAESWSSAYSLSLTGFATGEQNDDGQYEIKTLMPEICRYNLTIVPEADKVEFMGETL